MKAKQLNGYKSPHNTATPVQVPTVYFEKNDTGVILTIDLPTYDCPLVLEIPNAEWEYTDNGETFPKR